MTNQLIRKLSETISLALENKINAEAIATLVERSLQMFMRANAYKILGKAEDTSAKRSAAQDYIAVNSASWFRKDIQGWLMIEESIPKSTLSSVADSCFVELINDWIIEETEHIPDDGFDFNESLNLFAQALRNKQPPLSVDDSIKHCKRLFETFQAQTLYMREMALKEGLRYRDDLRKALVRESAAWFEFRLTHESGPWLFNAQEAAELSRSLLLPMAWRFIYERIRYDRCVDA